MRHPRLRFDMRAKALATFAVLLGSLSLLDARNGAEPAFTTSSADNPYIGVGKCKNCHKSEDNGNQFGAWEESRHSKAFETLASDQAKAIAQERDIADPQKAPECVKCHVTAYGVPEDQIKKGFKLEEGVQCETCHGPGDRHMKERFKGAATAPKGEYLDIPDDEVVTQPKQEVCAGCHNEESPTYKPFCYYEAVETIAHLDPRNTEREPLLPCGCKSLEECPHGCPDEDCPVHHAKEEGVTGGKEE